MAEYYRCICGCQDFWVHSIASIVCSRCGNTYALISSTFEKTVVIEGAEIFNERIRREEKELHEE